MSGGFGLCGNAEACIEAIARSGVKNLTIISNNCGNQGQGLAVLLKNRQVARVICSFVGGNPDLAEQYMKGQVKVELSPQGTFAERIRAGGAGIAGFYTPTGVGTVVAEGKEVREIDGRATSSSGRCAPTWPSCAPRSATSTATCASTGRRATSTRSWPWPPT